MGDMELQEALSKLIASEEGSGGQEQKPVSILKGSQDRTNKSGISSNSRKVSVDVVDAEVMKVNSNASGK